MEVKQPEEQLEDDGIWFDNQKAKSHGQHLAQQVSLGFSIILEMK